MDFMDKFTTLRNWDVYGTASDGMVEIIAGRLRTTRTGNGWNVFGIQMNDAKRFDIGDICQFNVKRGPGSWYGQFQLKDVRGIDPNSGTLRASITFAATGGGVRAYMTMADGSYGESVALNDTDTYTIKMVNDPGGVPHLFINDTDCGVTNLVGYTGKKIFPTFTLHSSGSSWDLC